MKRLIKEIRRNAGRLLTRAALLVGLLGPMAASAQFWFGSGTPVTNTMYSSCIATTYTTINFPGASVQLVVTNGNTQLTNGLVSSFGAASAGAQQLPSMFNAGGVPASAAAPWTTNLYFPQTNIMQVPVYWYYSTAPMLQGLAPGSNYTIQAQP